MNTWKILSEIDCSQHIKKKGKLSYLSWPWAWSTLMENYPDASYTYSPPLFLEDGTCEVSVSVTVKDKTHTMWLPVMDNRNNSIANPTSRDISDARMRCLVKAIAMFGLGAYIYAGEDLPESVSTATVNEDQAIEIKKLVELSGADEKRFLNHAKAESINSILAVDFDRLKTNLQTKLDQKKQAENQ